VRVRTNWNTKDPNAELEPYNRILNPKEDTRVEAPSANDFSESQLIVKNSKYTLLKFDLPALPDIIAVADLQLYRTTAGNRNLKEVLELCLDEIRSESEIPEFAGIHQIEV